jgi:hypothetical protein
MNRQDEYLVDVTAKNVPIYRMTEEFVKLVLQHW